MTARSPARALLHAHRVIRAADAKLTAVHLLEMALETEIRVARGEHLGVHRAVRAVTGRAALVHRLVLEDIRAALRGMTFQTALVLFLQRRAAAHVRESFVRRMTFRAGHPAFGNGMMTRQAELAANIAVTGEADVLDRASGGRSDSRTVRVGDRATGCERVGRLGFAAGFSVKAARAVTGFATGVQHVRPAHREQRVIRRAEIVVEFLMALLALLRADVSRAGNIRQQHVRALHGAAGSRDECQAHDKCEEKCCKDSDGARPSPGAAM